VICDRFGGKGGGSLELIQIGGIPLSVKLSDIYGLISEQI
jgi:hypothetical protein